MEMTSSGLLVPSGTIEHNDIGAKDALTRQFAALAKLEAVFPALVKLCIDVATRLTAAAHRRCLGPQAVMLDTPRWHHSGQVVIRCGFDPEAERVDTTDKAAKNYTTLREVNADMPQAVDLALNIAHQLVPAVNVRKLLPQQIAFSKPRFNADDTQFVFTVAVKGKGLALPSNVEI